MEVTPSTKSARADDGRSGRPRTGVSGTSRNVFMSAAVSMSLIAVGLWLNVGSWSAALLILFCAGACVALTPLRQPLLSRPVFTLFRRLMPALSTTEREALEAGSTGWEAELFSGRPDWRKLRELPPPRLSAEEQAFLDGPVEQLCRRLDDWRIHRRQDLPRSIWDYLKEQGFFGMVIPRAYGGLEFSTYAHSQVVMKIASRSGAAGVTVMVPNSLGPAELLVRYGSERQREHYLPRLARGQEIPCFALTSPEAGSDAASIRDEGIVCRGSFQGRENTLGIRLNWNKRYITLAPAATLLGLAFTLRDPEGLLGGQRDLGITLALIPTDTEGVWIGHRHYPLDIAFLNGPTRGRDVFIPIEWIIGEREGIGRGWRMLMECLAAGRAISLPASSTGTAKKVCRAAGAYARVRRQFKQPIGRFEGVEEALARIAGYSYAMDATRSVTAAMIDAGQRPSVISAIVKYNLTEYGRKVVNDGMDVVGGAGICMGPRNWLGRLYQALPIGITVEGANILTRSMIVFGQGAVRSHPFLLREMEAVRRSEPAAGLREFDRALWSHAKSFSLNLARLPVLAFPGPANGTPRYYYRQLARMSSAFAMTTDAMLVLFGGGLRRREKISGRLADVLSQLYIASCVLKHFEGQGSPEEDRPLVDWVCRDALHRIQESLYGLFENLPQRSVAFGLRGLIFPFGRPFRAPGDELGRRIAQLILAPSRARDRLTGGMFLPDGPEEPLARLDEALEKAVAAEPAESILREALRSGVVTGDDLAEKLERARGNGILSDEQATRVLAAEQARADAIEVDDFPFEAHGWRSSNAPDQRDPDPQTGVPDRRQPDPVPQG